MNRAAESPVNMADMEKTTEKVPDKLEGTALPSVSKGDCADRIAAQIKSVDMV